MLKITVLASLFFFFTGSELMAANAETFSTPRVWLSTCQQTPFFFRAFGITNFMESVQLESSPIIRMRAFYGNGDCNSAPLATIQFTANGAIRPPISDSQPQSLNRLDLEYSKIEATVFSNELVSVLNGGTAPSCGVTNWQLGVARTLPKDNGTSICPISFENSVHDIISRDGDILYFGERTRSRDASSEQRRPTQIDRSLPYRLFKSSGMQKVETRAQLSMRVKSSCRDAASLGVSLPVKGVTEAFTFSPNASRTLELYSDEECKHEIGKVTYYGNVTVGSTTGDELYNLVDFDLYRATIEFSSSSFVEMLNKSQASVCGLSGWIVNYVRPVPTGVDQTNCWFAPTYRSYDIVKTDGKSLYLGKRTPALDASSADKRPAVLNMDLEFAKY